MLQGPSGGSLSDGVASVMEVHDIHARCACSQQDELLRHYGLYQLFGVGKA